MKPIAQRRRRSALETFAACPAKYHAEYMEDIATEGDATRRGECFHVAREYYIRELVRLKISADRDAAELALTRARIDHPLPTREWRDVQDLWWPYVERFELNLDHFYATEQTQTTSWGGTWTPDLLLVPEPGLLLLDDPKTNYSIPSQAALDNSFQARMYLTEARRMFPGFARYEMRFDFVRYHVQRTVAPSAAELDETDTQIMELLEAIDIAETTGQFPERGGSHCSMCYRAECSLANAPARFDVRAQTEDEARELVRRIAARHRANDLDRMALRSYADANGAVESGGIEWAHRPVTKNVYPADGVVALLQGAKLPCHLTLSQSAVKPIVFSKRKYVAIADSVAALAQTKTTTEFRPRRSDLTEDEAYEEEA